MNDFDEIMKNANYSNSQQVTRPFNKSEWLEKKKQEKQEVYELMNKTAKEIVTDVNKYKQYLDIQGRFDMYSVGNALIISSMFPNATRLKGFDSWRKDGVFIKKGEVGINILKPVDYTKSDGTPGVFYNVKKIFDVSQTNSTMKPRSINYDDKVKLIALLKDCPVNIKAVDEIPNSNNIVEWHKEDSTLYVERGGKKTTIFKQLAKEFARVGMEETDNPDLDNFKCISVAYMLSKKYNIDVSDIPLNSIPEALKNMDAKEVRKELNSMRDVMTDINARMNTYFEDISKVPKSKEKER